MPMYGRRRIGIELGRRVPFKYSWEFYPRNKIPLLSRSESREEGRSKYPLSSQSYTVF